MGLPVAVLPSLVPLLCDSSGRVNTADELRWSVPQVAPPGDAAAAAGDADVGVVGVCGSSSSPCAFSGSGGDFRMTDLGLPVDVVVADVVDDGAAIDDDDKAADDADEKNDSAIMASLEGVCAPSRVRPRGFFVTCSGTAPSGKHSSTSDAVFTSVHCGYWNITRGVVLLLLLLHVLLPGLAEEMLAKPGLEMGDAGSDAGPCGEGGVNGRSAISGDLALLAAPMTAKTSMSGMPVRRRSRGREWCMRRLARSRAVSISTLSGEKSPSWSGSKRPAGDSTRLGEQSPRRWLWRSPSRSERHGIAHIGLAVGRSPCPKTRFDKKKNYIFWKNKKKIFYANDVKRSATEALVLCCVRQKYTKVV